MHAPALVWGKTGCNSSPAAEQLVQPQSGNLCNLCFEACAASECACPQLRPAVLDAIVYTSPGGHALALYDSVSHCRAAGKSVLWQLAPLLLMLQTALGVASAGIA